MKLRKEIGKKTKRKNCEEEEKNALLFQDKGRSMRCSI